MVGGYDARALGMAGWSLNVQHAYDPAARTLYLGNGERRRASAAGPDSLNLAITTIAGGGVSKKLGDGGPATQARLDDPERGAGAGFPRRRFASWPLGVVAAPDGVLFVTDANNRVRRIDPDGKISTYAGGSNKSGDDLPATMAQLHDPVALALAPDGSLYIVEGGYGGHRIRKVTSDGRITTVAGAERQGFAGDGGLARAAQLHQPAGVAVAPDGTVYVADLGNHRIRRIE